MRIGIDASRAFNQQRTGVEEYAYCLIRELADLWSEKSVVLYLKKGQEKRIDFSLGKNWELKLIPFDNFWTQLGLSWEVLRDAPDVLFAPAHVIPLIHPASIMTVHGLEYEHSPSSYSLYSRFLHRFLIKNGCFWSDKIIAVSEKTKKDLATFYKIPEKKIQVVHNGFSFQKEKIKEKKAIGGYLFFIGRLEERKNVEKVIEVFERLKKEYAYSGRLVLAGKPGFGYQKIKRKIDQSEFSKEIIERGFVGEQEKWRLLRNTDAVLYPSWSEGFGLPILEAQRAGVPVVASNIPSSQEVAGEVEFLFSPEDGAGMAKLVNRILTEKGFREKLVALGQKNVEKFSWKKCAKETAEVILGKSQLGL